MGEKDFIQEQYEAEQRMQQDQQPGGYQQQGYRQGNFNVRASINGRPANNSKEVSFVFKLIGGIFMAIGIVMAIICMFVSNLMTEKYDRCTETTSGVVIRNVLKDDSYAPVFSYEVNGEEYEVTSSISQNPPKYSKGDEVEIHYNPDKPEEFYVDKALIIVQIILYGIGGFFFLFGLVFFIVGVNVKRKNQAI